NRYSIYHEKNSFHCHFPDEPKRHASTGKIYNPEANAKEDIKAAVKAAAESGKHIFLQIGGNWCPWCIKFHRFTEADAEINDFIQKNFVVVKVNYDPKNKNEEVLAGLGYPQRFGFPVFVVLDDKGNRIHTQNSAFLEKDKDYDRDKVLRFFKNWSPAALDPANYQ
ncbi:MAG: thioredoxin family protein, partial [Draconibacterium sp.]